MKRSFSQRKSCVRLRRAIKRFTDLLRGIYQRCMAWVEQNRTKMQHRPSLGRNGKPLKGWERLNGAH